MFDCSPVTVSGEDAPVAVNDPGDDVTVNDVAAGDDPGREKDTDAAPLLNGRDVPTSVAVTLVGDCGCKKSFDAWDFLPDFFPAAIFIS